MNGNKSCRLIKFLKKNWINSGSFTVTVWKDIGMVNGNQRKTCMQVRDNG